jgi:RNA polymerase sigma-70 factor (sigma-E family)
MAIENVSGDILFAPRAATLRVLPSTAHEAFAALVREHHDRLARLAHLLCSDREQAEDAVAEAYAKVWPRFRRGQVEQPRVYLRAAVINQVRGGLRRRLLERREEQRQRVDWRLGVSPESNIEDRAVLEPALRQLPEGQREVIVLRFYEDMSEDDIATLLRVPVGTVKSRCARGLHQLRALMSVDDD